MVSLHSKVHRSCLLRFGSNLVPICLNFGRHNFEPCLFHSDVVAKVETLFCSQAVSTNVHRQCMILLLFLSISKQNIIVAPENDALELKWIFIIICNNSIISYQTWVYQPIHPSKCLSNNKRTKSKWVIIHKTTCFLFKYISWFMQMFCAQTSNITQHTKHP